MDRRLCELAKERYQQQVFLATLFELALEEQWFELQHMVQHDMAKAILADYSYEKGAGYLNSRIFLENWEEVIAIGWQAFCEHTGLPWKTVKEKLKGLQNNC